MENDEDVEGGVEENHEVVEKVAEEVLGLVELKEEL